jgi:NitT/TauT family transport system substrate-binding protein
MTDRSSTTSSSRRSFLSAMAAVCVGGAGCGRSSRGDGSFTIGYLNNITHAQVLVGAASGRWARALGASTKLMAFPAGPAVMEALAAGSIDAGFVGPTGGGYA